MRRTIFSFSLLCLLNVSALALRPEQWNADLLVLRQAIAAHPNPFTKVTKTEFDQRADALAAELERLNDAQVVARLAELVALLGDGHTRLTMPVAENAHLFVGHGKTEPPKIGTFGSLPIRLTRTADGLVVTSTTEQHRELLGSPVVAIQQKPIAQPEAAVRRLVHGDSEYQRDYLLPQFLVIPELLRAVNVVADPSNVLWTFRLPDGKEVSRPLTEVGNESVKWLPLSKSSSPPEKRHWYRKSPDGLVYARCTDILNDPEESIQQFAKSLFAEVQAIAKPTLVLDLRDNQGGDNTLNDAIVRAAICSGKVWEPGRFFVLINSGTFSAAANLATLLERWTPAIFVGQPTGGAPNGYGDPKRTILPNSGLTVRVSSLYWQVSSPSDKRDCITPLLAVEPTAASLRDNQDLALDLIQSIVKASVATNGTFVGRCAVPNQQLELSFKVLTDTATLTIHKLGLEGTTILNLQRNGAFLQGNVAIGSQTLAINGRFAGSYFLGWLDISGRPYSFVTKSN